MTKILKKNKDKLVKLHQLIWRVSGVKLSKDKREAFVKNGGKSFIIAESTMEKLDPN